MAGDEEGPRQALQALAERVAERVLDSPDAEDFLGWHAGTMEYWMHAIVAGEARRLGAWAARTEVPYMTGARVTSARGEKWSDGAVIWPPGFGALVEAKAFVAHTTAKVRADVRAKVAPDLDALLGIDWPATLSRPPGRYEDPEWVRRRRALAAVYALQIVLVHGMSAPGCGPVVTAALEEGVAAVGTRYAAAVPAWSSRLGTSYRDGSLVERHSGTGPTAGHFMAWAARLRDTATSVEA